MKRVVTTMARSKGSAEENDVRHVSEGVRETECEAVDWIHLAHDKYHGLADVNTYLLHGAQSFLRS